MTDALDSKYSWILLIYRVPAEPSKNRLKVWRQIKKSGAVYLHNGICALPNCPASRNELTNLANRIIRFGGEARVMVAEALDDAAHQSIINEFNTARNREYREILEQCGAFLNEIKLEIERENFTGEEVDEIENDLIKLKRWLQKVRSKDWFAASLNSKVDETIKRCENELQDFITRVYHSEKTAHERAPLIE